MKNEARVHKGLRASRRRLMMLLEGAYQPEVLTEDERQGVRRVSLYGKTAAALGSIEREGREDDVTSGAHTGSKGVEVAALVFRVDEEVKDGAIVPDVDGLWQRERGQDVGFEPRNPRGALTQTRATLFERRRRNVEHRDMHATTLQEGVDQNRRASPHIDEVHALDRELFHDFVDELE